MRGNEREKRRGERKGGGEGEDRGEEEREERREGKGRGGNRRGRGEKKKRREEEREERKEKMAGDAETPDWDWTGTLHPKALSSQRFHLILHSAKPIRHDIACPMLKTYNVKH